MTKKQIETLKHKAQLMVRQYAHDTDKIMEEIKRINNFIQEAYENYLINDYSDVLKLQREIGAAAMEELEKVIKEVA